jgi:hypothetical protein
MDKYLLSLESIHLFSIFYSTNDEFPSFLLFNKLKLLWTDFYSDTTRNTENRNNSRIPYTSGSFHLNHLFFILINSSAAGGALSFTSGTNNQILIEETLF